MEFEFFIQDVEIEARAVWFLTLNPPDALHRTFRIQSKFLKTLNSVKVLVLTVGSPKEPGQLGWLMREQWHSYNLPLFS